MKTPLFLVGYRCVGKTTVARHLARMLETSWVDLDRRIEEDAGCSIAVLVSREGWAGFRDLESLALERVMAEGFGVIATGGGIVTRPENIRRMREGGWVVRLDAKPETVILRMAKDEGAGVARPALTEQSAQDEIIEVMTLREDLYAAAAHGTIATDHLTPEAVALRIVGV